MIAEAEYVLVYPRAQGAVADVAFEQTRVSTQEQIHLEQGTCWRPIAPERRTGGTRCTRRKRRVNVDRVDATR